jgi:class 3 adenylate cyclase
MKKPKKLMEKQIYLMRGSTPREWSELDALGPFPSQAKARAAIRADVLASTQDSESLSPGKLKKWADVYVMVEVLKVYQPTLHVDVSVSL